MLRLRFGNEAAMNSVEAFDVTMPPKTKEQYYKLVETEDLEPQTRETRQGIHRPEIEKIKLIQTQIKEKTADTPA